MRRYYGHGYHDDERRSVLSIVTLVVACFALALSAFMIVGRKPADTPRVAALTSPTPAARISPPVSPPASVTVRPPPPTQAPSYSRTVTRRPSGGTATTRGSGSSVARLTGCRNSTSPSCGGFFWSPAPSRDLPMSIRMSQYPDRPVAGEAVTFSITATDGDALIRAIVEYFGEGARKTLAACPTPARYGPWTPPARKAGSKTISFTHTYAKPGTYKASFTAASGECGSPYGGTITLPVEVVVGAAPSPAPGASA